MNSNYTNINYTYRDIQIYSYTDYSRAKARIYDCSIPVYIKYFFTIEISVNL